MEIIPIVIVFLWFFGFASMKRAIISYWVITCLSLFFICIGLGLSIIYEDAIFFVIGVLSCILLLSHRMIFALLLCVKEKKGVSPAEKALQLYNSLEEENKQVVRQGVNLFANYALSKGVDILHKKGKTQASKLLEESTPLITSMIKK